MIAYDVLSGVDIIRKRKSIMIDYTVRIIPGCLNDEYYLFSPSSSEFLQVFMVLPITAVAFSSAISGMGIAGKSLLVRTIAHL